MNTFFAALFIILNFLDFTTTKKILALGGEEFSPIPKLLMKIHLFTPIKIFVTLFISFFIVTRSNILTGVILCGIISIFVINNYYQLYMHSKGL